MMRIQNPSPRQKREQRAASKIHSYSWGDQVEFCRNQHTQNSTYILSQSIHFNRKWIRKNQDDHIMNNMTMSYWPSLTSKCLRKLIRNLGTQITNLEASNFIVILLHMGEKISQLVSCMPLMLGTRIQIPVVAWLMLPNAIQFNVFLFLNTFLII